MFDDTFLKVIDELSVNRRPTDRFLKTMAKRYGLENAVYFSVSLPIRLERPYYATTYSPHWVSHYFAENYARIDPALHKTLGGILPIDWSTIQKDDPRVRKLFGESIEFKVGNHGLSFPIRGIVKEKAVFSVSGDLADSEWQRYSRHYMRDFQTIGYFIHSRMMEALGLDLSPQVPLLNRELECLRWSAVGKNKWEIGEILTISERTVKFHLDQARHKLNCTNVTHAVAKSIAIGLIALD